MRYVLVHNAPLSVWRAYHRGVYPDWSNHTRPVHAATRGRAVRIGSYGDPAACPVHVWARFTAEARTWTGYTHQWRRSPYLKPYCMASVENTLDAMEAWVNGWRTFRIGVAPDRLPMAEEVVCPASAEAGHKTTCENCNLCMGASSRARKHVMIAAHGPGRMHVTLT